MMPQPSVAGAKEAKSSMTGMMSLSPMSITATQTNHGHL